MISGTSSQPASPSGGTLFGHPAGLFTLFFVEMWERFSYYGMRALLVLYMVKGFLRLNDGQAYAVYGAYTALVYATPFLGGLIADRVLGARRAVVLGGSLMAGGHLAMTIETESAFHLALALLITGNGLFKPNISTLVGRLYEEHSPRRDGGFTIFYMGINLGAALSPLVCGYVGETYGWHYGFGLATIGMVLGVLVFVVPIRLAQVLIAAGALGTSLTLLFFHNNVYQLAVNLLVAGCLLLAGGVACVALGRGGIPVQIGAAARPPRRRGIGSLVLGLGLSIPLFMLLVRGGTLAGWLLTLLGGGACIWLLAVALRSGKVERERLFVVLILMFFSLLFWAFFEQAGSSMNQFADRNVDRVIEARVVAQAEVGRDLDLRVPLETTDERLRHLPALTQEQLGHRNGDGRPFTLSDLDALRRGAGESSSQAGPVLPWRVGPSNVGMGVGGAEIPTSLFQAANPIFILLCGLGFTLLWSFLGARRLEPSTPAKFALGLVQLGLGFAVLWYGARTADARGMVAVGWLLLAYLLHTMGELCISPVGLSMVTKLAPARVASTVMGAWFLATAFSNFLAGLVAQLTGVRTEGEGNQIIPPPVETVHLYGDVFGQIAVVALLSAVVCLVLTPWLRHRMHSG